MRVFAEIAMNLAGVYVIIASIWDIVQTVLQPRIKLKSVIALRLYPLIRLCIALITPKTKTAPHQATASTVPLSE